MTTGVGDWPLSGRSGELDHLQRLLRAGRSGAVLTGAAGAGKTRLATEFLASVASAGLPTVRISGTRAAAGMPLGAWGAELPPGPAPAGDTGSDGAGAERIRHYAAALAARAAGGRLVLMVDDAHLLDPASAALVHQLALGNRAFVVACVLTGAAVPDPVAALWKDGLAERCELPALGPEVVDGMLAVALGAPLDPVALAELTGSAGSNLHFLRALVRGAVAEGSLRNEGGIWRAPGGLEPPAELVDLVEDDLAALAEDERAVLELVAFGEPLGSAEVQELSDASLVERLERRGLVVSALDRRRLEIRVALRVHRDVLRHRLPALRRQALAGALVDVVEGKGARRAGDVLRGAVWRLDGDWANAEVMLAGARAARWRYDFPLAERLARAAAEAGGGFEATLLAAQMAAIQGRSEQAEAEFRTLAGRASTDGERALVGIAHANHLWFSPGRVDEGLQVAEEARSAIADEGWRDEITARAAGVLLATEGPAAAAAATVGVVDRAEGRALVTACFFASIALGRTGRVGDALDASQRGHAAHVDLGDVAETLEFYPATHLFHRCDTLSYAGRLDDATELATEQYEAALAEHSWERQALFAWARSKIALERGHVGAAERSAREAIALHREFGRTQFVRGCLIHLALAVALSGRATEAEAVLSGPDAPDFTTPLYTTRIDLLLAWAWTAAAGSDLPRARRFATNAATLAHDIGDAVGEASALHALARLGRARDARAGLQILAGVVEGPVIEARAAHVGGLVADDPEGLEQASAAFATMGADLLAAEAAADAAVSWRRHGDVRRAAAAQRMSGLLAARCQGASTPALAPVDTRVHLTPAERDAAQMAASGLSNREIAETLHLSVRTIGNQLQRVYNKLGVSSRAELRDALDGDQA